DRCHSWPQHRAGDVPVDETGGGELVDRHEFVGLVGDRERTGTDDGSLSADAAEVDEIATALEAEGPRIAGPVGAAGRKARRDDGSVGRRLGRAAGGRAVTGDLRANAEA